MTQHASAVFLALLAKSLRENVRDDADLEAIVSDLGGLLDHETRETLRQMTVGNGGGK